MNDRFLEAQEEGIWRIDTGLFRTGFDAVYLVGDGERYAFIDSGVNASRPRLLGALAELDIGVEQVEWVLLTHVHLDHAGGAGGLMQALPNARLGVHSRGVRHMVDPSQLVAGATAVYGEAHMQETYGRIPGVAAERVDALAEGMRVAIGRRVLEVLDTPGHARHHVCYHDATSASFFTGDTFGISYPEFDVAGSRFVMPTSTPVQFDPDALIDSIRRMLDHAPRRMYLTHFGWVEPVPELVDRLIAQIHAYADLGRRYAAADAGFDLRAALAADLETRLSSLYGAAAGAMLEAAQLDLDLNAQGLAIWARSDPSRKR